MSKGLKKLVIEKYAELIFANPGKALLGMILFAGLVSAQASNVETVEQQTEDFLPDSEPVIDSFITLSAEFSEAGGTRYTILIETSPDHANSNEIRDVRNPEFLRYVETISNDIRALDKVSSVDTPSGLFSDIPSSKQDVSNTLSELGEPRWSRSISTDYQAVRIIVESNGLSSEEQAQLAKNIRRSIEAQEMSNDFEIGYTGQLYIDEAFQQQSNETMGLTSIASLVGVLFVVIYLFRSIYYGLNSLLTVIFGIAIGFGVYGILGLNMTPQTSGAISLGIGIAVDFGIQPIARYREERESLDIKEALAETIDGVITPMTVGLMAANIGFLALAVGKLTFLKDLGILLTLTTTMAYIAAFTVLPSSIVFYDRYFTGEDGLKQKLYYKVIK